MWPKIIKQKCKALADVNAALLVKDVDAKDVLVDELLKLIYDEPAAHHYRKHKSIGQTKCYSGDCEWMNKIWVIEINIDLR